MKNGSKTLAACGGIRGVDDTSSCWEFDHDGFISICNAYSYVAPNLELSYFLITFEFRSLLQVVKQANLMGKRI